MQKHHLQAGFLFLTIFFFLGVFMQADKKLAAVVIQHGVETVYSNQRSSVLIDVPFSSQAPYANWSDPYQEACEEASLIMVEHYLRGKPLTLDDADQEIINLTIWEEYQNLPQDITIQQLARVAEEYYGLETEILYNPTIADIKSSIANGQPVIVPAAGRRLGNPFFSGEGPWYHMLVIIGYDDNQFITNDPGTRRGEHYTYNQDVLFNAIHNWTGVKEEIEAGERIALVLSTTN